MIIRDSSAWRLWRPCSASLISIKNLSDLHGWGGADKCTYVLRVVMVDLSLHRALAET